MALIKKIAIYDSINNTTKWYSYDIGAKAENVSLSSAVLGSTNVQNALSQLASRDLNSINGTLNLSAKASGVLPVSYGGTGNSTIEGARRAIGTGTSYADKTSWLRMGNPTANGQLFTMWTEVLNPNAEPYTNHTVGLVFRDDGISAYDNSTTQTIWTLQKSPIERNIIDANEMIATGLYHYNASSNNQNVPETEGGGLIQVKTSNTYIDNKLKYRYIFQDVFPNSQLSYNIRYTRQGFIQYNENGSRILTRWGDWRRESDYRAINISSTKSTTFTQNLMNKWVKASTFVKTQSGLVYAGSPNYTVRTTGYGFGSNVSSVSIGSTVGTDSINRGFVRDPSDNFMMRSPVYSLEAGTYSLFTYVANMSGTTATQDYVVRELLGVS